VSFTDPPLSGVPFRFFANENSGGSPASSTSAAVPDNETWVLLGVDFFGVAGAAAQLTGTVLGPAGQNLAAVEFDLTTPTFYGGTGWRGALPFNPGETFGAVAAVDPSAVATAVSGWGVILPFVAG
jgi:hypothetical protein